MTSLEPATVAKRRQISRAVTTHGRHAVWLLIPVLVVVAAILEPAFVSPINLLNVVRQASVIGVASIGLTFVVLVRGIDVSVAAIITAAATGAATVMNGSDSNIPLAILFAISVGVAIGTFNGVLAAHNIQPFILTLGVGVAVLGAAQLYTGGTALGIASPSFRTFLNSRIGPVPILALVFMMLAGAGIALHRWTRFGRRVVLVGANPLAARLSGVRVDRFVIGAYALSGATAGLAGLVLLARSGPPSNFTGMGLEYQSLAAVILGGTSLDGGVGGVGGSVAGALVIALAFNLVNIAGLDYSFQQIVQGGVIIVIAAAYAMSHREGGGH